MSTQLQVVSRGQMVRGSPPTDDGMTGRFVLTALRRWWKIALPVALLLAGGGSAVVYLLFEPVYESSAWLQIEERTPYLAFETREDGRSKLFFQTQIETIRSPLVLGPVIKQPEIANSPQLANRVNKVEYLSKRIRIVTVGESELFRIVYASPDPRDAANVVNAVTDSYFKLRDLKDADRNDRIIELLNQEKTTRSRDVMRLRENLRTLAEHAADKDPFAAKIDADSPQKHPLADLQTKLIQAQVDGTVLDARIKAAVDELTAMQDDADQRKPLSKQEIALRDTTADRIIDQSPEVQRQREVVADVRQTLSDAERVVAKGKRTSVVERLKADLHTEEAALSQLQTDLKSRARREAELTILAKRSEVGATRRQRRIEELDKMRSDRAACLAMEKTLKARYDRQRKDVEQSSGDTLELSFKRDELAQAEKVFELISQRALQLQIERGAPARVRLMQQRAEVAEGPVESFPFRDVAVAVLAGLCLPFGLAVVWERLLGRVSDPAALERQSKVAVLGEIAQLPVRSPIRHDSASVRVKRDLQLFEESIDSLRTSLSLSTELGEMRILAVTSAANHEGKTSVASQLAVSFARATGKKLLLIDGDMRCPDIHNVFGIDLEPGLVAVLSGKCRLEDAIVTSWSDMVHLLPAGKLEVNPHTLLGNGAWPALLKQIPACYRYVVIDTPPVLSASEALVLTKGADASLVCAMRDVTRVDQLRRIIDRLEAAGSRPVGLVLNGVPVKDYSYRYGDYGYAKQ